MMKKWFSIFMVLLVIGCASGQVKDSANMRPEKKAVELSESEKKKLAEFLKTAAHIGASLVSFAAWH